MPLVKYVDQFFLKIYDECGHIQGLKQAVSQAQLSLNLGFEMKRPDKKIMALPPRWNRLTRRNIMGTAFYLRHIAVNRESVYRRSDVRFSSTNVARRSDPTGTGSGPQPAFGHYSRLRLYRIVSDPL